MPEGFELRHKVASLPLEFARHDFGITGGGVTAFEAAAAGLPTIVIANEPHEVAYARYLQDLGCAIYGGTADSIQDNAFDLRPDIPAMSRAGMAHLGADGAKTVLDAVLAL